MIKSIGSVILIFSLSIAMLHLSSCKAFTKSDAQALGVQIAKSSLAVAAQVVAGQPVDLKAAVSLIGLQAASSAVNTVTYNLNTNASPQSIVSAAHDPAQAIIASAAVPDPEIAAKAAEIATQAIAAAQDRLGAEGVTSGK